MFEYLDSYDCKSLPHLWDTPNVGDSGLTCMVCGREIAFADLSSNMLASITNGRGRALMYAYTGDGSGDCLCPVLDEMDTFRFAVHQRVGTG